MSEWDRWMDGFIGGVLIAIIGISIDIGIAVDIDWYWDGLLLILGLLTIFVLMIPSPCRSSS